MLTLGQDVLVRPLKRRGTIVGILKPGTYRVQLGAIVMTAREDELEPAAEGKRKKRAASPPVTSATGEGGAEGAAALGALDLHGLTVDEARNRVAAHISRAILAGLAHVEIIHGIGTGRLKSAVTKDLKALAVVRAVKPHPTNPGITVAYL